MRTKTKTQTLIEALHILARDIQSEDGVANAAIAEAAERMREFVEALEFVRDELVEDGSPDCPGHDHVVRGRWDANGKPCAKCARWKSVWDLVGERA